MKRHLAVSSGPVVSISIDLIYSYFLSSNGVGLLELYIKPLGEGI